MRKACSGEELIWTRRSTTSLKNLVIRNICKYMSGHAYGLLGGASARTLLELPDMRKQGLGGLICYTLLDCARLRWTALDCA